ncbi:SDR family NAD(P)-dependent oxidoreductase [Microbacterium sp. NPDC078428]|uniref:SDR family NAD(P)-dependent oxidoreductase n=1 Tax=Microbacterium sp. NPDC078428 TaxID=3364190 RepID=UPI0037CBACA7
MTANTTGTALITGAGGGLGRAISQALAARGITVVAADIDLDQAQETVRLIETEGGRAYAVPVDVTDPSSAAAAVAAATAAAGPLTALVNNAAIYATIRRSPFDEITVDEWDRVMAVNLRGPWVMAVAARHALQDGGRIVNISSATVFSGSEQWAHYVASKAGVIGLTRVLARELGPRGITVNAVAPGFTLTEASYALIEDADSYGVTRSALKRSAQPDDIVGAVLYLTGPDSGYITGQTLVVDGGRQFI